MTYQVRRLDPWLSSATSARVLALCLLGFTSLLLAACEPAPRPPIDVSPPPTEHEAADAASSAAEVETEPEASEGSVEVAEAPTVTPMPEAEAEPSPSALLLNDVAELEGFLREEGIALTFNEKVKLDYLPGMARIYEIGSGTDSLQLHEYPSVEETDEAAGCFSPDAMFVNDLDDPGNPFKVEWFGSPHVFRSQNLLATYIGDDPKTLDALTQAFGPQIAGF